MLINNNSDTPAVSTRVPTHFIFVNDNSGSMYGAIEPMKRDLKNQLATLIAEDDSVSILTFSGPGDVKIVLQDWKVQDISKDIEAFHKAIDNHIRDRGATCFNEPLEKVIDVIGAAMPGKATSVLFLTDGYHNMGGTREAVLKAVDNLSKVANNFTVVEYGDYCDHKFLMEIVEKAAANTVATHMYQENIRYFEPVMEKFLKGEILSTKKIEHELEHAGLPFVWSGEKKFFVHDKKVFVPVDLVNFYSLELGEDLSGIPTGDLYALAYHLASMRMIDEMYKILGVIGDKFVVDKIANSFGVEFTRSVEYLKECITDESKRFIEGKHTNVIPKPDAFCIMDMLGELAGNEENKFYPGNENFSYNRISAKKVQTSSVITEEQKKNLVKAADLEELQKNVYELKFVPNNKDEGYKFSSLTWNIERANVSVRIQRYGIVDVAKVPSNTFGLKDINTYDYKTFTIIQDGRKNITTIPASLDEETFDVLKKENVIAPLEIWEAGKIYVLSFNHLPVINRQMVQSLNAKKTAALIADYEIEKASIKTIKYIMQERGLEKANPYSALFNEEQTKWLETIGIGRNGFSPKLVNEGTSDEYIAQVLNIKIKGLSSLPAVKEVLGKSSSTISHQLIRDAYEEFNTYEDKELEPTLTQLTAVKYGMEADISEIVFSLILGQTWFDDIKEGDAVAIDKDSKTFEVSFDMKEETVKI